MIKQADCGIIVPYGDVPALEAALLQLQNEPDLRRRLGENSYLAYQTTYNWTEMEIRLRKLYAEVTGPV